MNDETKRLKELRRARTRMKRQLETCPEELKPLNACMLIILQERMVEVLGTIEERVELENLRKAMRPEWLALLPQIKAMAPPIPV
ncbi:hypothetical protein D2T29_10730 [Sinirhodobacter populi]|uniref:Uncharacterized protein n=1 Tax=Paenirhodobacter populi TaxID=2306993 RepID=A0A443KFH5_9RHOB|nr:hypothetical protein [Sinirhodobacter populi]RWR31499.1 hypothetical protein D2T29_10730 [Sinirhodobacter populi]